MSSGGDGQADENSVYLQAHAADDNQRQLSRLKLKVGSSRQKLTSEAS